MTFDLCLFGGRCTHMPVCKTLRHPYGFDLFQVFLFFFCETATCNPGGIQVLLQCQKHCLDYNMARQTHGAYMLAAKHKKSEYVGENYYGPLHFERIILYSYLKLPWGMNRQDSIYYTTKRNYFVIKSNLHWSEHPWNPTKLTRGKLLPCCRTTIPLLSSY